MSLFNQPPMPVVGAIPRGSTLATLLGSQADSTAAALIPPTANGEANTTVNTNGILIASFTRPLSSKKGKKGRHASSQSHSTVVSLANVPNLPTPFTHTVHQTSLLTSILKPQAPPPALASSLDTAQTLLMQLLPKEIDETPEPVTFHALFMNYLDACAGVTTATTASNDKKKPATNKRKRGAANDSESTGASVANSASAIHHALHTVSTTVIGRLAGRCIQLLNNEPVAESFDDALLESTTSYWSVLSLLLRSDSLSARFTPNLFPLLTRHSALPLIECALVHLHDASERDLVELAKYALNNLPSPAVNEKQQAELALDLSGAKVIVAPPTKKKRKQEARAMVTVANSFTDTVKVVDVPGGPFAVILDLLLTSPVSTNFLRHSLAALEAPHAHKLLLYLYAWTLRYWFHTESEVHHTLHAISRDEGATAIVRGGKIRFRIPSFSQVIDWMNILLDAIDFTSIYKKETSQSRIESISDNSSIASSSSSSTGSTSTFNLFDLVSSLASHISHHHLKFLDRSQDLKGFISIFAQMKRQPNAQPLPQAPMMDYNVELLELGA